MIHLAFATLPSPVASIINEEVNFTGPNCHNTSLRASGTLKYKRYVSEDEMHYVLNNYCEPLLELGTAPPADTVGVFMAQPENRPFHSFVLINNHTVFTKNGLSKKAKPIVQSYEDMFILHLAAYKSSCRIRSIENCDLGVDYYVCQKKIEGLSSLEARAQDLLVNRQTMLSRLKQKAYLKSLDEVVMSENCVYEKLVLGSLVGTLESATYATISTQEKNEIELLKQKTADVLSAANCF